MRERVRERKKREKSRLFPLSVSFPFVNDDE